MLRSLGTLLLIVPLLLPQGVCVCALVPHECTVDNSAVAVDASAEVGCCRCCKHAQTKVKLEDQPLKAPQQHAPACPAKPQWKAQPTGVLTLITPATINPLVEIAPSLSAARLWTAHVSARPTDRLLYRLLSTLLI